MDRSQLSHALRACFGVLEKPYNLVVVGSQAILAYFERDNDLHNPLFISQEVDIGVFGVDPETAEKVANQLSGALGDGSHFNRSFGFYVDGITLSDLTLAPGWEHRLQSLPGLPGQCAAALSVADLVVAKIMAHRAKDLAFIGKLVEVGHPDLRNVSALLSTLPPSEKSSIAIQKWAWLFDESSNTQNTSLPKSGTPKI